MGIPIYKYFLGVSFDEVDSYLMFLSLHISPPIQVSKNRDHRIDVGALRLESPSPESIMEASKRAIFS